jgi:pimeloyl-ACP methyl ester carboxylesterase
MRLIGSTLPAVEAVSQPWLIIHGTADDVVPIQDGRDAFEAATCEKEWLEIDGAEHSFDEQSYPKLVEGVDGFLSRVFA